MLVEVGRKVARRTEKTGRDGACHGGNNLGLIGPNPFFLALALPVRDWRRFRVGRSPFERDRRGGCSRMEVVYVWYDGIAEVWTWAHDEVMVDGLVEVDE